MIISGVYKFWEESLAENLGIYSYFELQRRICRKNGLEVSKFSVSMLNWWRVVQHAQRQVQISWRSMRQSSQPLRFLKT